MAIKPILRMGHPVLSRVADPVPDPTAPEIAALVADLKDSLAAVGGTGLAAPQIGVPLRVVIFAAPAHRLTGRPDDPEQPLTAIVNPVIEPLGDAKTLGWEGCLSIPGMRGEVPRHDRIRYHGYALDGSRIDRTVGGFHARIVQHEFDHLDGLLYPARMVDMSRFGFTEEMVAAGAVAPFPQPVKAVS
ncbi:peptide deformylase [Oceanibaculum pacificum]|uniref:Peptide deformylase n=1 Tax=Oceanibaculum pacificum TaxID=580166 RepID=A0A154VVR9_9PROT|nr:peptide deformylase [Oceanibaculum pacificum]KZD05404.1 peptide deformylase [Oceanibaculum pacificum]